MFSCKAILGSILIAAIGDFVAFKYYPQGGSRVHWTYSKVTGNLMKLRNVTHKLADMFCNNPEQCKNATDEFFAIAADIPQDFLQKFAEVMNSFASKSKSQESKDQGTVNKNNKEAKIATVNYTAEVQSKGDAEKAETVIKSLRFSSYDENNLCDLMEGIPPAEYDATVDEIADLTNMPEKLKKVIKRAKNFAGGKVQAVNRLQFKSKDGNMVFGRVTVIRRGEFLDIAYSLHSVAYDLAPIARQSKPENAEKLNKFSESLGNNEDNGEGFEGISIELREDFLAFFHKQAIQGFVKHCDYVLKAMKDEDGEGAPEVRQNVGVRSDGAAVGDDKTEN